MDLNFAIKQLVEYDNLSNIPTVLNYFNSGEKLYSYK